MITVQSVREEKENFATRNMFFSERRFWGGGGSFIRRTALPHAKV